MERLTIRLPDGQACVDCNRCKSERTSESNEAKEMCSTLYCRNRLKDRLAAFEDTFLDPDELLTLRQENETLRRILGERFGPSPDASVPELVGALSDKMRETDATIYALRHELDVLKSTYRPNCVNCEHIHRDNFNCTAVGGFCTAVPAAHCPKLKELMEKEAASQAKEVKDDTHAEFLERWATELNNRNERNVVPAALEAVKGLVVVYAASDDLVEIEGAMTQEIGAFNGVKLTASKTQGFFETAADESDIEFRWCDDNSGDSVCPWSVICNLPHRKFDILDDEGYVASVGVVLHIDDIPE
jgi:hypothetical protein